MTVIDILQKAHDLIERGWTQHASARDADGMPCSVVDPEAESFCLLGAVLRPAHPLTPKQTILLLHSIAEQRGIHTTLTHWNDDPRRKKEDVLEFIKAAIYKAASQPQKGDQL